MKTITISTENSETYSSISNFFIDYYMTEANGEFVKVYLYLVRLLNSNQAVTVAAIADHFNLTENDICRAIKYWISKDVLRLNYDGNGRLSGIVLLPLHAPTMGLKMNSDAVSILKVVSDNTPKKQIVVPDVEEEVVEDVSVAPTKPNYTKNQLANAFEDTDLADIQYLIETLFGKPLTPTNCATVLYIYDSLEFSPDLFEYLVEYCVEMKKTNFRYMEAVAIAWYNDGIKTRKDAKAQASSSKALCNMVFKSLGIRQRIPTDTETAFINTWSKDFGFSNELIKTACDKAMLTHPDSANFSYVNAILENWNKSGVKTLEDVARLDKEHMAKTATRNLKNVGNVSSFSNFKQTRLDSQLAEMEELFLREVNN
ncbi:MAG: DnaD domain protein [Lachnospiraceae bacterium]|nr:DnaD domain protein [Lachnospiraceae bacterium]